MFERRIQNPGKRLNIGSRSPSANADEVFRPGKKLICPTPPPPKLKGIKSVKKDQITSLVGAPQLNKYEPKKTGKKIIRPMSALDTNLLSYRGNSPQKRLFPAKNET